MDDAGLVGRRKPGRDLAADIDDLVHHQAALLHQLVKVAAPDVGHRDELVSVGLAEIVDPEHVAVGDAPCGEQLLFEAGEEPAVLGVREHVGTYDLESDRDAELEILGQVDGAHAA